MANYIDNKGKKLEIGIYNYPKLKSLVYFNGYYDKEGVPVFHDERGIIELSSDKIKTLKKLKKEEADMELDKLKKKAGWLEKLLNKDMYILYLELPPK